MLTSAMSMQLLVLLLLRLVLVGGQSERRKIIIVLCCLILNESKQERFAFDASRWSSMKEKKERMNEWKTLSSFFSLSFTRNILRAFFAIVLCFELKCWILLFRTAALAATDRPTDGATDWGLLRFAAFFPQTVYANFGALLLLSPSMPPSFLPPSFFLSLSQLLAAFDWSCVSLPRGWVSEWVRTVRGSLRFQRVATVDWRLIRLLIFRPTAATSSFSPPTEEAEAETLSLTLSLSRRRGEARRTTRSEDGGEALLFFSLLSRSCSCSCWVFHAELSTGGFFFFFFGLLVRPRLMQLLSSAVDGLENSKAKSPPPPFPEKGKAFLGCARFESPSFLHSFTPSLTHFLSFFLSFGGGCARDHTYGIATLHYTTLHCTATSRTKQEGGAQQRKNERKKDRKWERNFPLRGSALLCFLRFLSYSCLSLSRPSRLPPSLARPFPHLCPRPAPARGSPSAIGHRLSPPPPPRYLPTTHSACTKLLLLLRSKAASASASSRCFSALPLESGQRQGGKKGGKKESEARYIFFSP